MKELLRFCLYFACYYFGGEYLAVPFLNHGQTFYFCLTIAGMALFPLLVNGLLSGRSARRQP